MKANKKQFPLSLLVLALVGTVLLLFSTVNGTRAALNQKSDDYDSTMAMQQINVQFVDEKGETTDKILTTLDEEFTPGKKYEESVSVQNCGVIDEYVRVVIYRYWTKDGVKVLNKDPEYIVLDLGGDGWVQDESAHTAERDIYYYKTPIAADEITTPILNGITVNSEIRTQYTTEEVTTGNTTVITKTYDYDGYSVVVEMEVDGVQTHNYAKAAQSAWGVDLDSKIGG